MTSQKKQQVEKNILQALHGELSVSEATAFLSMLDKNLDKEACYAVHAAVHFLTDEDLRKEDEEYDHSQRQLLSRILESLRKRGKESGI